MYEYVTPADEDLKLVTTLLVYLSKLVRRDHHSEHMTKPQPPPAGKVLQIQESVCLFVCLEHWQICMCVNCAEILLFSVLPSFLKRVMNTPNELIKFKVLDSV